MIMLIIVCGLPGSGKTTLAKAVSRALKAVHLSSDITRKEMFPSPTYTEEEKKMVYMEMAERAKKALAGGKSVVADATFYKKWQREMFISITSECALVLCALDEEHSRKRLTGRKPGGISDADYDVYLKLKQEFEPINGRYLKIDTMLPLKERVRRVLGFAK
jgi:predicted kinase